MESGLERCPGGRWAKRMAKKQNNSCREIAHTRSLAQRWAVQIFMSLPCCAQRKLSELNNDFILARTNQTDRIWISHLFFLNSICISIKKNKKKKLASKFQKLWNRLIFYFLDKLCTKKMNIYCDLWVLL